MMAVAPVFVARTMGPAELLDYDRTKLRGLILEEGSPTSHVAIVARALDIPLIGRIEGILDQVESGDWVIADASGAIYVTGMSPQGLDPSSLADTTHCPSRLKAIAFTVLVCVMRARSRPVWASHTRAVPSTQ